MTKSKPDTPNWFVRIGVTLVILALAAWAVSYLMRPTAEVVATIRSKAIRAEPGTVEVKAEFGIELKSEVGGRILSSALVIGKRVTKGEVLVQIDPGDSDLEIERIKFNLASAKRKVEIGSVLKAEVENSKDSLDNLEAQTKAGAYPAAELAKVRRTHAQLVQRMELDEASLKLEADTYENSLRTEERKKSKMTITAPADGVVTDVIAREGDLIGSDTTIGSVIAIGRTVLGKLSEEKFAAVRLGQRAKVRFLIYGGVPYDAVVTKILPAADPLTQRYTIYLDVTLPEGRALTPGITGELFIIVAERDNALLIPSRALHGNTVFVVEGGKVSRRKVEKGYESLNQTEILSGVQLGDQVIVEQVDRFHDGERVRVQVDPN